ncbi:MAG: BlaI/MecI/CopY family transcriptional regulator [Pseudomonadota bacterium]
MSKKSISPILTETELELMTHLWELGGGTVREVLALLPSERKMAYTSASTILRILEQKKVLVSEKQGKAHIYKPVIQKQDYEATTLNHVIKSVFADTPSQLVKRLVNSDQLSAEEREEIRRIISEEL